MEQDLGHATKLQTILWAAFMDVRYGQRDMLEVLDETTEHLSEEFFMQEYDSSTSTKTEEETE